MMISIQSISFQAVKGIKGRHLQILIADCKCIISDNICSSLLHANVLCMCLAIERIQISFQGAAVDDALPKFADRSDPSAVVEVHRSENVNRLSVIDGVGD